jgi:hypothetical protein
VRKTTYAILIGLPQWFLLASNHASAAPLQIEVEGPNAPRQFFIVGQIDMTRMIVQYNGEAAAIRKIATAGTFGPMAIGRSLPLDAREDYLVFPVCGVQPQLKLPGQPVSGRLGRVRLACR